MAAPVQTLNCKHNFEWTVPRTAFDSDEPNQFIKSKEFRACPDSKSLWELRLYPCGRDDYAYESLSLSVGRLGALIWNTNDPCRVIHRLGFIASDGTEANVREWDCTFHKNAPPLPDWGWDNFIPIDELFNPTKNLFKDHKLTIFCELEVHWIPEVVVPESTLSHDWSEMLESGKFSDVVLVVGEEKLKAHKLVLSARSPVFAAMFEHDMIENQTGRVEIKEFDVITIKALLTYLYSDKVTGLEAIAEEVLPAADYYGVERLKLLCEREICKNLTLTVESVMDKLNWAWRHNANKLKARALRFIQSNASEVLKQGSFWDLADSNHDRLQLRQAFTTELEGTEYDCDGPEAKRIKLN